MSKGAELLIAVGVFVVVWVLGLFGVLPLSETLSSTVPYWPFNALCCFGCYSLGVIGYNLVIFGDADVAHKELLKEVEQARADLTKKGLKF
eukprot:m.7835 g.7835  ORF g.7835 m.7835 type:complete len:91 (-) comp3786_c0_seq1:93-365(-)